MPTRSDVERVLLPLGTAALAIVALVARRAADAHDRLSRRRSKVARRPEGARGPRRPLALRRRLAPARRVGLLARARPRHPGGPRARLAPESRLGVQPGHPDGAADQPARVDAARDPVVRRVGGGAGLPHLPRRVLPDRRRLDERRAERPGDVPAGRPQLRPLDAAPPRARRLPGGAAADPRGPADRARHRVARRRGRRDDRGRLGPRLPHHRLAKRRQALRSRRGRDAPHRRRSASSSTSLARRLERLRSVRWGFQGETA